MPKGIYKRTDEHKAKLKENFGNEIGYGYWTGKSRSEATKKKLSEFHTGKVVSVETKEKMSLAHKGKNKGKDNPMFGKQSPNWKGGTTPERQKLYGTTEWKELVRFIFERDMYTCKRCGCVNKILHAHHLKGWAECSEDRRNIGNLITVCKECHRWIHSKKNIKRDFIG